MNSMGAMKKTAPISQRSLETIQAQLGPPAYRRPGMLIYCGDCLELMRRLHGTPFHLTVTSPPYNIGKEYERVLGISRYLDWCERWIAEIYRLTGPTGAFWLNMGYLSLPKRAKAIPIPYLVWDRIAFYLIQEVVWNYGAGVAARKSFSPRNEKFLWYVKNPSHYTFNLDAVRDRNVKYPKQKKHGKLKCNPLGKNPTDVWQIAKVTSGKNRSSSERTAHPAQFPVAVVERIVRACSNERELILDPFLGSGTVAEVALRNNRRVLGIEIEEKYVEVAAKRLDGVVAENSAARAQKMLFELVEADQLSLLR